MSDRTVRVGDQTIAIVGAKSPIGKFERAGERTVRVSGQKLGSSNFIPPPKGEPQRRDQLGNCFDRRQRNRGFVLPSNAQQ